MRGTAGADGYIDRLLTWLFESTLRNTGDSEIRHLILCWTRWIPAEVWPTMSGSKSMATNVRQEHTFFDNINPLWRADPFHWKIVWILLHKLSSNNFCSISLLLNYKRYKQIYSNWLFVIMFSYYYDIFINRFPILSL